MNQQEFAAHIGKTPGYVTKLKKNGRLVIDDGRINVEASLKLIEETQDPSKAGVIERHNRERQGKAQAPTADTPAQLDIGKPEPSAAVYDFTASEKAGSVFQQSRAIREKYNAMAAKRDYEISIGTLLVATEVAGVIANAATIVRTRIESMPDILAPQFAAEKDEQKIRALWIDYNEMMLTEMCKQFQKLINL